MAVTPSFLGVLLSDRILVQRSKDINAPLWPRQIPLKGKALATLDDSPYDRGVRRLLKEQRMAANLARFAPPARPGPGHF